jgi:hypothetical protein
VSRQLALNKNAQVTLDSGGAGQASAGPAVPGEYWQITGVAVSAQPPAGQQLPVNDSQCYVYLAPAGPFTPGGAQLLGATSTGSSGDSFGPVITVCPGQVLLADWQLGDDGVLASMNFWGTRTVP